MPPSRRRPVPPQQPPARRPRVAGLRRPVAPTPEQPEPEQPEQAPAERVTEAPEAGTSAAHAAVEEPEDVVEADEAEEDPEDDLADDERAAAVVDGGPSPRPRPSGKRRAVGLRAPSSSSDLAEAERRDRAGQRGPARAKATPSRERTARSRTNLAIGLAVLALVCAGLAIWFRGEANGANDTADSGNTALTDTAGTSQLIAELRPPIEAVFSVDYQHLDKTQQAASANLTGDALKQYQQLFGVVRDSAPKQKLVSTFKIRNISVMSLRGDTAEVLVFADQTSNKPCDPRDAKILTCGAAIGVPAQRIDGHWKIAGFDMFNAAPVG